MVAEIKYERLQMWPDRRGGASRVSVNINKFEIPTQLSVIPDSHVDGIYHFLLDRWSTILLVGQKV